MRGKLMLALLAAALVAVCAAWPAVASNSAGFADPAGDSGNAPDITAVNVSNDDSGTITFRVTIANRPSLSLADLVLLVMDTDANPSNGIHGFDYLIGVAGGNIPLFFNGASGTPQRSQASSLQASYTGGVLTISVNRADIGNPTGPIYFYLAGSGDGGATTGDDAPDGTAVWSYQMIISAAPPATTTPTPTTPTTPAAPLQLSARGFSVKKAKVGNQELITAGMAVSRSDTGGGLEGGQVACAAKLAGKAVKGFSTPTRGGIAVCVWRVPVTAATRGKLLTGSITVTSQGAKVARSFSTRV
jgi:hypothetical protein